MDFGSKKPLNFKKSNMGVYQEPESSWDTKIDEFHNKGVSGSNPMPIIRGGSKNGIQTSLSKGMPKELNPDLVLEEDEDTEKAVLTPVKIDSSGRKQLGRKRDGTGKFAPSENLKIQTTGEEDAEKQQRAAQAAKKKQNNPKDGMAMKGMNPTMDGTPSNITTGQPSGQGTQDPNQMGQGGNVIGQTNSGMPIYDDPFNPAHAAFTDQDYTMAAQLMQQMGDSQKATIFQQLAKDAQSPMDRFSKPADPSQGMGDIQGQQSMQQAANAMKSLNPFNWFFQQNHPTGAPATTGMPGADPTTFNQNTQMAPMNSNATGQAPVGAGMEGSSGMPPNFSAPMDPNMQGRQGPAPGMINTQTGTGMGPQTNASQFAGTTPVQEEMPQDPYNGTDMGHGQSMAPVPGLPAPDPSGAHPPQFGLMQNHSPQSVGAQPIPQMAAPGAGLANMPQPNANPLGDPNQMGQDQGEDVSNLFDFSNTPPGEDGSDPAMAGGMGDNDGDEGLNPSMPSDNDGDEAFPVEDMSAGGDSAGAGDDNASPFDDSEQEESEEGSEESEGSDNATPFDDDTGGSDDGGEEKEKSPPKKDVFKALSAFINKYK